MSVNTQFIAEWGNTDKTAYWEKPLHTKCWWFECLWLILELTIWIIPHYMTIYIVMIFFIIMFFYHSDIPMNLLHYYIWLDFQTPQRGFQLLADMIIKNKKLSEKVTWSKKKKNREVKNINQGEPEENEDGEGVQRQKVGRQQWKQRGDLLCDLIVRVLNTVTAICYFTACLSVMTCLITTYTNNTAHYCRCFLPLTHMHTHTHTFYNTDKRDNTAHYCLSL